MSDPQVRLRAWGLEGREIEAVDGGLINRTWILHGQPRLVLQWVNGIFSPLIHHDIQALTRRLTERGVPSPHLVPTLGGALWEEDEGGGCWRVQTFIPGRTLHRLSSPRLAGAAGALVGRFHQALAGWEHEMVGPPRRAHDTAARMSNLVLALEGADDHRLEGEARGLGAEILADWEDWGGPASEPERICHGDLKVSNLRFADDADEGVALIDLDTVAPMSLGSELGDAWRSWCNPAGESAHEATRVDRDLFEASARGWCGAALRLDPAERAGLVAGIERICLELAGRFCADAVENRYFREDLDRFPALGDHNLLRARGQLLLARSARSARSRCEEIIDQALL